MALELGIQKMVVASETGGSALKALQVLRDTEIKLIVVTHYSVGWRGEGLSRLPLGGACGRELPQQAGVDPGGGEHGLSWTRRGAVHCIAGTKMQEEGPCVAKPRERL
ncbi:hypothetical protein M1N92_05375 [Dehalococcoidia bacterium]|nr:hypothetical protein [Dehalococcoidia bacterium]